LLRNSKIQTTIAKFIAHELSTQLQAKVSVGFVDYRPFNSIAIENLYIEDQHKDTLLYTKSIKASFSLWKIMQGNLSIHAIELDNLKGNVMINRRGVSNFDFIIQALKQPKKDTTSHFECHINKIKLNNSELSYTNKRHFQPGLKNTLNFNQLKFNNINTEISIEVLNKDSMYAHISDFSAVEKCGFKIDNFKTAVQVNKTKTVISFLELELPNSFLQMKEVEFKYKSLSDFANFINKVKFKLPIQSSYFAFDDLKYFAPTINGIDGAVSVKGTVSGKIASLKFQKMELKYGKTFVVNADIDINGLPKLDEAFIYGNINEFHVIKSDLQDLIADLTKKPVILPKEVDRLGMIQYKGNISGFLSNLVVYGNIETNVGTLGTDILLKFENNFKDLIYDGTVKSASIELGQLLADKNIGKIAFNVNTKGEKKQNTDVHGVVKGKVSEVLLNKYSYKDINFDGNYDGKGFDGEASVHDENISADFYGKIDLTKALPILKFDLNVANTNLNALKITNSYPGATLSFNVSTNLIGNSLDNINGSIAVNEFTFLNQNKKLSISKIDMISRIETGLTNFSISSDFINGSASGDFKYSTIGLSIMKIAQSYLPSLAAIKKPINTNSNVIYVDLKLSNTQKISEVLGLPYKLEGTSSLKGSIDEKMNKISVKGEIPALFNPTTRIENINFHCDNIAKALQLTSRAQLIDKAGVTNLFLSSKAAHDSLFTKLVWHSSSKITNAGEINTAGKLKSENDEFSGKLNLLSSQIIISDSIWKIHPSSIDFNADSTVRVNNFLFESGGKEFVKIDGLASKNQKDSINLTMNKLDLGFLLKFTGLRGITFDGDISGKASLFGLFKQPVFDAKLEVANLKINDKWMGNAKLLTKWDKINSKLVANGHVQNAKKDTIAYLSANYTPKSDTLNVLYDGKGVSIDFLTPYFGSVLEQTKGFIYGKVHMYGPLKTGMVFRGDALVKDAQLTVKSLKACYHFTDSVHVSPKAIQFKNIQVYDQERNLGYLTATLKHNGGFGDLKYDASLKSSNIMGMNTQSEDNEDFYGKAYASGKVRIYGDENEANIFVDASTQPKTKCFIQMGGAASASDNGFVKFEKKNKIKKKVVNNKSHTKGSFNVKVNLQLDVTPDAEMELIVDPKGGDMISGKGSGNLRVEFDTNSDIKLFGRYTISSGYYLLTVQNAIRKEFKIDKGGDLSWTGDPYGAQVNLRAIYPLTASLKDLMDEAQLESMGRTTVPVNCVLKLTEVLRKPTVNFDVDLPSSDEGVKQQVRNIINTDEMMNRQMIYLLMFNKFYRPDYMRNTETASSNNFVTNEGVAFLASTVSAQFNNLLSKALNSNDLSLGLDMKKTDDVSSVYQTNIVYQPNSKLLVNGSVGYRADNLSENKYITDVDVEYKLFNGGKFRLKGYNHTVDRNMLRTAKQTQGVGLLYKEDFNSVTDLFTHYWDAIIDPKKKKKN